MKMFSYNRLVFDACYTQIIEWLKLLHSIFVLRNVGWIRLESDVHYTQEIKWFIILHKIFGIFYEMLDVTDLYLMGIIDRL